MDEALLLALNGLRAPWLDVLVGPLADWGLWAFPLLMLLAPFRQGWRAAPSIRDGWLTFFVAMTLVETIIKPIVARPRPTADAHLRALLHVLGRVPPPTSLAFPSGTAACAFAGATWIALRWGWRPGAPALALAALVSLSRIYGGIHWPTDILAGALIGAACAFAGDRLGKRIASEDQRLAR